MGDALLVLVAVVVTVVLAMGAKRVRSNQRSRARTTSLTIDDLTVQRVLQDGRTEVARWAEVTEVEVVRTTVPTADGAREFVLVAAEAGGGCLIPLDSGHDTMLLMQLARLPGFSLQEFSTARRGRPPARTVVWTR